MLRSIYILLLFICCSANIWADGSRYASESLLSTGKWVKIQVDSTAIYKLTYAQLRNMGFSNPEKVSVHGYGGWPLEEDFSKNDYIDDIPATAIWRGPDYILFYGRGPVKWEYDGSKDAKINFVHTNNPYSTSGYYFLTDATEPKIMGSISSQEGATLVINHFDDYDLHELEKVSINTSGRELYGESFYTQEPQPIKTFYIPGTLDHEGKIDVSFVARPLSTTNNAVTVLINDNHIISGNINIITGEYADYTLGREAIFSSSQWKNPTETSKLTITYNNPNDRYARLNYIRLQIKRSLQVYGAYTFFRNIQSIGNVSTFRIQNANTNTFVFDVTDGINPKQIGTSLNGTELTFTICADNSLREFAVIQADRSFPSPQVVAEINNQNLHGLSQTDMVIISPNAFRSQAERLAEAHREKNGLSVIVVDPQHIYNEFSSGTPDATAYRRFMKMFYDRSNSNHDKPKYLLLFGDGAYDNRFLTEDWKKSASLKNVMLLTYQTKESLNHESYVVDDYFGVLQNNTSSATGNIDIGVGRLPIRTLQEATHVVDKLISYMDNKDKGAWKNNLCFLADDGQPNEDRPYRYMQSANSLANTIERDLPQYNINKIYFDYYKKNNSGGNGSYPDVETAVQSALKNGLFLLNYTGHGNTSSLSDEKVIKQSDISQYNYPYLPLWITTTCDFTRFDAISTSAGEDVILNPNSGGIALITTSRVAYASINDTFNNYLMEALFTKEDGKHLTLGEIVKNAKNKMGTSVRKQGYTLIGDPALRLSYPESKIEITKINGEDITEDNTITFKALQKVTIEGEIHTPNGSIDTEFNGFVYPTVLDSKISLTTQNNSNLAAPFTYTDYAGTIFTGNDVVENGKFSFTFTVPKDISYSDKEGKIVMYAYSENGDTEASGSFQQFKVGGTDENAGLDTEGPEIRALYLNDSTFVEGGKVNSTPFFIARIWDETGVNITGNSIGHDMMLIIDNSPQMSYNLNGFYETIPGTDGEGMVKFLIPELEPGIHTGEFKVWDVYNNSTTHTFTFEVVEGLKPVLAQVIATPIPAREKVTFYIYHNRPESTLTVSLMVYDMTGRLQWKHEERGYSDYSKPYAVTWDLRSNSGSRLRPGVYIYRAAISTDNSKEATEGKKLIILGQ